MDEVRLWVMLFVAIASLVWTIGWSISVRRDQARKSDIHDVKADIGRLEAEVDNDLGRLGGRLGGVEVELREHAIATVNGRAEIKERLVKIEESMRHLPDSQTVQNMALHVMETRGDMKVLKENHIAIANTTRRLEEHLLTRK